MREWWTGYLLSEIKIQGENFLMGLFFILQVWDKKTREMAGQSLLFYSALVFAVSQMLANFAALTILHRSVTRQLRIKDDLSTAPILQLFRFICRHLEQTLTAHNKKGKKEQNVGVGSRGLDALRAKNPSTAKAQELSGTQMTMIVPDSDKSGPRAPALTVMTTDDALKLADIEKMGGLSSRSCSQLT